MLGALIERLEAELERVTRERDAAILEMSRRARLQGEAEGKLRMSEHAGLIEGWRARATAAEAALATERDRVARLRELVQCLIDNDPDDPIADGGHVVLDLWRHDAARVLASIPEPAVDPAIDARASYG